MVIYKPLSNKQAMIRHKWIRPKTVKNRKLVGKSIFDNIAKY